MHKQRVIFTLTRYISFLYYCQKNIPDGRECTESRPEEIQD